MRCPHLNLMVLAIGLTRRLVTTAFFPEQADPGSDPILNSVVDPIARGRLLAQRDSSSDEGVVTAYRFDLILRGPDETPFFLD